MSINSRFENIELQIKDEIQKPSGQFAEDWIKVKDISMAIFNKDDRIFKSNTIEATESTHTALTYEKGLLKGSNRVKKGNDIFDITSVNDDAPKSVIMLKKVIPSGETI